MSSSTQPSAAKAPPAQIQAKFDLGIWYSLFNWPNLTVAIQNQWGGPDSADKRDWLAGAISDIFSTQPDIDQEDIEVVLLQALEDEFGVRIEDDTEVPVAEAIMKIRVETREGNFETVDELQRKWEVRKGKEVNTGGVKVVEKEQEGEWDSVDEETDDEDEDEDGDVDMGDAPPLVPAKPKPAPEVDEEGFTRVVGKRRK